MSKIFSGREKRFDRKQVWKNTSFWIELIKRVIWSDEILEFKFRIWYLRNPFPFNFRKGNFLESRNFEFLDFKAVPDGWGSIDRSVDGMIPDWKTFLVRKTIPNFWSNNLNQMHEPRFFKLFWSLSGQRFVRSSSWSSLDRPGRPISVRESLSWTIQPIILLFNYNSVLWNIMTKPFFGENF